MQFRTLAAPEVLVSEVGLGCWQIGGDQWGDVPETEALATLRAAYEGGITFYDTADIYGQGRSESLVARFAEEVGRQTVFIATKLGRWPEPGLPGNATAKWIRAHTEASLGRLRTDCLDLTQLHCVPLHLLTQDEVFSTLDQLKQQGKIRRWGASVESTAEALHCLQQPGCASLQVIFNLFRQTPSLQLFERCLQQNVSVIVRLPLASGLLAGRYTPETTFAPTDHRSYNRNGEKFNVGETFAGVGFETGLKLVEALRPMVPSGQTLAEFALAFCLSFPAVTTIIPGARNADQARRNAAASDRPKLPAETLSRLRQFYQEQVAPLVRGPD